MNLHNRSYVQSVGLNKMTLDLHYISLVDISVGKFPAFWRKYARDKGQALFEFGCKLPLLKLISQKITLSYIRDNGGRVNNGSDRALA